MWSDEAVHKVVIYVFWKLTSQNSMYNDYIIQFCQAKVGRPNFLCLK